MRARIIVAALSLSAAGFVGIIGSEGYTDKAVVPTRNDRPTVGFGSTFNDDGSPVKMGDTIDPVRAVKRSFSYLAEAESGMKSSLEGVALTQGEFDIYMDWRYQYGATAWAKSSMLRELKAGNYRLACDALLKYKFSGGFDCSAPGNRVCAGVWKRQLERHAKCIGEQ